MRHLVRDVSRVLALFLASRQRSQRFLGEVSMFGGKFPPKRPLNKTLTTGLMYNEGGHQSPPKSRMRNAATLIFIPCATKPLGGMEHAASHISRVVAISASAASLTSSPHLSCPLPPCHATSVRRTTALDLRSNDLRSSLEPVPVLEAASRQVRLAAAATAIRDLRIVDSSTSEFSTNFDNPRTVSLTWHVDRVGWDINLPFRHSNNNNNNIGDKVLG